MSIPRIAALLAATAALFTSFQTVSAQDPQQDQQQDQQSLSARIYDVRDLVRHAPVYLPSSARQADYVQTQAVASDDQFALIEIGDLASLLREATGPEHWDQDGVEMRPEDTGLVSVRCSTAVHTKLRETLRRLRATILEQVLVEVLELPSTALDGQPAVLDSTATQQLLEQAGAKRRFIGRAIVDQPLLLEASQVQNRVAGLPMMVAQSAAIPDPTIDTRGYGPSWRIQVTRTTGDALLVSFSGHDRRLENTNAARQVPSHDGRYMTALTLPTIHIATCAAGALLLPGQGLLLGSNAATGKALCVRVRPIGPPIERDLGEITAYPIRSLVGASGRAILDGDLPVPNEENTLFPEIEDEPMPAVFDEGRLMEVITSTVRPDSWDGAPNTMNYVEGSLYVRADAKTQSEVADLLRSIEALDSRQYSAEFRFGEATGTAMNVSLVDGVEDLAASLPHHCLSLLSTSRDTRLSATRHRTVVRDFKSAIAQGVGAPAPVLGSVTDGFLLRAELAEMGARFVRLDLDLTFSEDASKKAVIDLQNARFGKLDKIDVRENKVRGTCTVELGKWTLMHMAPLPGTDRHVAVIARVTAL